MMKKANCRIVSEVDDAELVVFAGGTDIDPSLYNAKRTTFCQLADHTRDNRERTVFNKCVENKIPMFGICRGAQLLHALNGGTLWQDVNNHAGQPHLIVDLEEECVLRASSMHHQMLRLNTKIDVIATTVNQIADRFRSDEENVFLTKEEKEARAELEIEAGAYWYTQCFFVQGHPEVGPPEYMSWSLTKLHDFINTLREMDEVDDDDDDNNGGNNNSYGAAALDECYKNICAAL